MRSELRGGWRVTIMFLGGTLLFAGCEVTEPEPQLRFTPSSLSLRIGDSRDITGIVPQGMATGTWFVQPNSIMSADIEITGDLTARLTCNQQGAGSFVLSAVTTAGMFSGTLYFICSP